MTNTSSSKSIRLALFLFPFFSLLLSINCKSIIVEEQPEQPWSFAGGEKRDDPLPYRSIIPLQSRRLLKKANSLITDRNPDIVRAIILHTTGELDAGEYLQKSIDSNWLIHLIVDKKGVIYGYGNSGSIRVPAAPGMDNHAIHIALEGGQDEILASEAQMEALAKLVRHFSYLYRIPLSNKDIIEQRGIFTHGQSKKRYGGFVLIDDCNSEKVLKKLLNKVDGDYYKESRWTDRYEFGWILVRESPWSLKSRKSHNMGRSHTPPVKPILNNVEKTDTGFQPKSYRLKYVSRGPIYPTCVVLHFTATETIEVAMKILEKRRLSAHIIVDADGKAYQVMDHLNEKAAAASDTNDHCIQIEIVGKNTEALLKNDSQSATVASLVIELSSLFKIPRNNHDVSSFSGIFSHTQAKKKWGRSVYLSGTDYDPGEPYMKEILKRARGKFYEEKNWVNRNSEDWAVMMREFQP